MSVSGWILGALDLGFRETVTLEGYEPPPSSVSVGAAPPLPDSSRPPSIRAAKVNWSWTLLLYTIVVAGACAKSILDHLSTVHVLQLDPLDVLTSSIVAAVSFRAIFVQKLAKVHARPIQVFLAFESGFFVEALFRSVAALYRA